MSVLLNIAGVLIDFDTRYPEYVRERCRGYCYGDGNGDGDGVLHLRATDEEIEKANIDNVGLEEAELYAMTIPLSEHLPDLRRMMTHGVAVGVDGRSYVFTAASGTGKSTHAFLWQKYLGEERVRVINGDKPILWFKDDGQVYACGSPWSGKEHLDENTALPLGGVCLLRRLCDEPGGGKPRIYRATREETFDFMMHQTFIPHNVKGKMLTFAMLEELYEKVPVYHLVTDISREGAMVSAAELKIEN